MLIGIAIMLVVLMVVILLRKSAYPRWLNVLNLFSSLSNSSCSIVFCCILQLFYMENGAFYRAGLLSVVSSGKHLAELSQL